MGKIKTSYTRAHERDRREAERERERDFTSNALVPLSIKSSFVKTPNVLSPRQFTDKDFSDKDNPNKANKKSFHGTFEYLRDLLPWQV